MKVIKVIGKILKIYFIWDVIALACVGAGKLLDQYKKNPELSALKVNEEVIDDTVSIFKNYLK